MKTIRADEYCKFVTDGTHDSPKQVNKGRKLITSKHLGRYGIDFEGAKNISESDYQKVISRSKVEQWDILFSMIGTIGNLYLERNHKIEYACKNMGIFQLGGDESKAKWLYYYLQTPKAKEYIETSGRGTTQSYVPLAALRALPVDVVDGFTRDKTVKILWDIDEKILTNQQVNKNLEQQAQALYREMFVNTQNNKRRICRAEEYFDIAIGKTPPRKEHQWFTTDPSDITWVSISDMGNCGTYISRSSEQITQEAVDKFKIKVIPSNTVLLSFKLTVGRIAITHGKMTTNEAIAHFKTDKPFINEYLYCYLKDFNYQTMGSTSSIATAVNSKIIKAMPFVIPADDEISRFHSIAGPMFEQVLNKQLENDSLAEMRDALLPRLMSGELDVSNIDF